MNPPTHWRASLSMLLVVVVWALNMSLVKVSLAEIPPLPYNGIRLLLASGVLLFLLRRSGEGLAVERRHLPRLLLLSVSGYTVYQALFISGIHQTTAANAAVIFGAAPLLISLLSSFFKHERIRPLGWLGIALGFAGVYLVVAGRAGGLQLGSRNLSGDLMLLAVVCLWAHYSVSARPLLKFYSPLKFTTLTMTAGSLLFLPFSVPALGRLDFAAVSLPAWLCLLYSGVLSLSLALVIWFASVRQVGNSQTAVYSNLQPVLGVLFAHLLLGEAVTSSLLGGAAVILAGIVLTRRGRQPTEA